MINEKVIDDVVMPLLIATGFPLIMYAMYCCFTAMRHRKPSHPFFLSIYAPASEFTEMGAKYRKRFFRCLIAFFVLALILIILSIWLDLVKN